MPEAVTLKIPVLLDRAHRKLLCNFQSLPSRVAISTLYLLLGEITFEARIHSRTFVFLQSVIFDSQSLQDELTLRRILRDVTFSSLIGQSITSIL